MNISRMEWKDKAILVGINHFRDNSSIITLFTENHGLKNSIVRKNKSNQNILNNSNILDIEWKGRLEEQMGNIHILNCYNLYSQIYNNKKKLYLALSMCELLKYGLHENEKQPHLFHTSINFLLNINETNYIYEYILFEKELLSEIGFGLDLSECGATGSKENLIYISPKTGRAISEEAGYPYKEKLFRLPHSLKDYYNNFEDQVYSLNILEYFISKHISGENKNKLLFYRNKLNSILKSDK